MRARRLVDHAVEAPRGDRARHLGRDELERELGQFAPPKDVGKLELIVARGADGHRETPKRVVLSPEGGVPGDAWWRNCPERTEAQISLMRVDVARLCSNGQPLSLFGDNLLVDLDLSVENLPAGSRLLLGRAVLEVTPEPHTGCVKFRQRFGEDALRLTADRRFRPLRLRGIYAKTVRGGEIALGDPIDVVSRG
jgi:hypothetical protein